MRKLILSLGVLIAVLAFNTTSFALQARDSSNKTFFQSVLVSSPNNANEAFVTSTGSSGVLMAIPGTPITGIAYSNSGTAGVVSIYDASQAVPSNGLAPQNGAGAIIAEVGVLECVFEATVAANTGGYFDLSNAPINTVNGVVVLTGGSTGVTVYTSNQINANH